MGIEITEGRVICAAGYKLENWSHVNWLIKMLRQNGEMLWGPEVVAKPVQTAKIFTLVKSDEGEKKV